jgi:hypothetical protein
LLSETKFLFKQGWPASGVAAAKEGESERSGTWGFISILLVPFFSFFVNRCCPASKVAAATEEEPERIGHLWVCQHSL